MMKRWMLKRTGTWFVLVVFLFTTVFAMTCLEVKAYAANDLIIQSYTTDPDTVSNDFELSLVVKNISGADISDVDIDLSSNTNIAGQSSGLYIDNAISTIGDGDVKQVILPLKYTGDGSNQRVQVTFIYGADESTEYISLDVDVDDDDDNSPPFVSKDHVPTLNASIKGNDDVVAGSANTIHINLKNISKTTSAKNIVFVPVYSKDSAFTNAKATSTMPIKDLKYDDSTDMVLSVDVDKFANPGVHPFTFKLSFANAWNDEFTVEYTVYLEVSNYLSNASFDIRFAENQSVSAVAGGTFDLPIVLINNGSLSAKDVKIALSDLSQDTFMLSSGTGKNDFYRIYGNESKSLSYTLKASSTLKSGSHPVNFDISFTDEKGTVINEKLQLWVPVAGNEDRVSMLEILEIKPSMTSVKPGESFDVSVKIKNSGEYATQQIKVSADGGTVLLPVSQNLFIIPSLQKGETKSLIFRFQPQPDAARGGVPITIKVDSVDGGENTSIAQAISVFVDSTSDGKPEEGKNIPKIIVKSYSSEPTLVKAGENFVLNLEFLNTHASKTVKNIKGSFVVVESSNETGNVFSPVESSNTFYIDEIRPKGTTNWTLTLYTIPDAKSKTYTITVSFEYEDEAGNPYKADELIGIPVYQPSRFEVSEFSLPTETFMGQPVYVGFEMYNMGKTEIYNVKLSVEGDFEAQPKSNYFGNFESGRTEYFEINLIPTVVGQGNGRIVFQYENASGEKQELVKEISMNVIEMQMPPDGEIPVDGMPIPGDEGSQDKGFFGSIWFYIILGVVVVGGTVAIILVVRKRKKNKEFDF